VSIHLGSALGLFQPRSGFLAGPSFAALFHAATVRGVSPFRGFPSQKSRTPLGATCSLAVIHRRAKRTPPGPCHRRFHRLPRSRAVAGLPRRLWTPFSPSRRNASRSSWIQETEPFRSASFTYFGALLLLRVRSRRRELPLADGRSSPEFSPLQGFLRPHPGSSNPPGPEGPNMPSARRLQARLKGSRNPSRRVRPFQGNRSNLEPSSSPDSGPLRDRPAPPLGGAPTPLALELRASPSLVTFEALRYVESGVSPRRSPSLLRFLASSTPS
jgi:hypothetical protein